MSIRDKIALVSGASRGIGKAIAIALAKEGIHVAVNYISDTAGAEATCREVASFGVRSLAIKADVSDATAVLDMVREVQEKLGGIDILINNAGIVHKATLEELTVEDWDKVMNINLRSAFLLTQACIGHMRQESWGRIINISSVAAQTGGVTSPLYVASKAGMIGLTHSYASLLMKNGITSNAITPALIKTDMVTKDLKLDSAAKIPMGRFGTAEEVAEVAVMLVKNAYITGQTINVNGGWYFS
ncbi:3-oxoacyl-ACP reductase family protein [Catalinimonas niigatensis]|uniref:3-oxoacyl-ACP reductase family protein n=1 Tax=Catalinimonas niigatensis TaxID=1397264 RepID=UPI002665EB36|nr:3-oxoacyl-ACP reductase family protein [Catalinimonas niigatensis]WPP49189.1 3-oxoacyl-ACP reductase family protein [Catalinimonas niigatensis]